MDAHSQNSIFQNFFRRQHFFPNLSIANISLRKLPTFYQDMVKIWIAISQSNPHSISLIHSQFGPIFTKNGQKYVILGLKWLNLDFYEMTAALVVLDWVIFKFVNISF